MSEPKPERITELKLYQLEAEGTSNPFAMTLQELLIPEVRRLRALIDCMAELKCQPEQDDARVDALVAEAEAIRKERV